jgi:hypothetical protein
VSDLREQIANEVHHSKPTHNGCSGCDRAGDAVWTNAVGPALDAKDAEIARLKERVAELQPYELGIKSLTTSDGSIDMSLSMAHDMMRIYVAAMSEILAKEGGPNYAEMSFKLAGSTDRYTLTIRQPDGKSPGEVASEQRRRAERAEEANTRALEVLRVWRAMRTLEPQTARFLYEVGAALAQPGDQPKDT